MISYAYTSDVWFSRSISTGYDFPTSHSAPFPPSTSSLPPLCLTFGFSSEHTMEVWAILQLPHCVARLDKCACSVLRHAHLKMYLHIMFSCVYSHSHIHTYTQTSCGTKSRFWQSHPRSARLPVRCVTEQKLKPASGDWAGDLLTHKRTHASRLCSCT